MSIPSYLANIKSSGIYRFVWDKSEVDNTTAEIMRLCVGYSEKGPFNTPVYIKTAQEFIKVFGGVSKKLEKRGVFFHRLCLQALQAGPIYCLNLKKFSYDEEGKYSRVEGVSFNPKGGMDTTGEPIDAMEIKTLKVEDIFDTTRFWNLDPSQVIEAIDEKGKQVMDGYATIVAADSKESSNTIFVRGTSDARYDVTVKEWYSAVTSEDMPAYFEGYEDTMISDYLMQVYVFKGKFTKDVVSTSSLSKYFDFNEDGEPVLKKYILNSFGEKVDTLNALANDDASSFINVYEGVTIPFFKDAKNQYISLDLLFNADYAVHKMMMYLDSAKLDDEVLTCKDIMTLGVYGASIIEDEGIEKVQLKSGAYNISNPITATTSYAEWDEENTEWSYNTSEEDSAYVNFYSYAKGETDTIGEESLDSTEPAKWLALGLTVGDRLLAAEGDGLSTITAIDVESIEETTEEGTTVQTPVSISIKFSKPLISDSALFVYNHTIGDITNGAKGAYIAGYTMDANDVKPVSLQQGDKQKWQANILSALTDYEGIRIALTNRKDIDYRYIVDTFEAFVEEECHAKISLIAKEKDNAFAIINFPSAKSFKKCNYASFTDKDGKFQVKYIVEGRNKQKPASVLFSLASETNGASFCGYFTPLIFTDGTVKTEVPSAAMVSNNFMEKYITRFPFSCVAGINYGQMNSVGLVGPDFNYSQADRDLLEPYGVNVMVFEPRRGTYINSNQTAKQRPETALSKINVRELVIYIQDTIEDMMRNYHWEQNTQELRSVIKSRADKICETIRANGGIYDFFCKCDSENNTPEIIDNEMIILSVSIEPAKGAGKMVQELTLYKTGGLSSVIQ